MTRLPSDSFLPSGALDGLASDSSSSVISPLSLPVPRGAATQYFDPHMAMAMTSRPTSRLSDPAAGLSPHMVPVPAGLALPSGLRNYAPRPSSSAAPRQPSPSQPRRLPSPHLAPTSTQAYYQLQQQRRQQRSVSLSPTRRAASMSSSAMARTRSAMTSPSRASGGRGMLPLDGALHVNPRSGLAPAASLGFGIPSATRHPQSASASATTPGLASQTVVVQQLKHQNNALREAWENERRYLEANRARAEEVYKEERVVMEAERADWEAERAALLSRIRLLEETAGLGSRGRISRPSRIDEEGTVYSIGELGGNGWAASSESLYGSESSQDAAALRNGDATRAVAFQAGVSPPQHAPGIAPLPSVLQQYPGSAFLSPPLPPQADFLAASTMAPNDGGSMPVPTVDVQEIHPELEGIPIKANAIKRPTFIDCSSSQSSRPSSGRPSPPVNPVRPGLQAKGSSSQQTLQVLAAEEDQRLTMHAGHTPSHSLSLIPTAQGTEAATTASSSGEVTPVLPAGGDGWAVSLSLGSASRRAMGSMAELSLGEEQPPPTQTSRLDDAPSEHSTRPDGDEELQEPLMIRNIPAKDEIFFRRLSEKLENVARTDDAPTVLKSSPLLPAAPPPGVGFSELHVDGAADQPDNANPDDLSLGDEEPEIPLKLKHSNNFGAPFGAVRGAARQFAL